MKIFVEGVIYNSEVVPQELSKFFVPTKDNRSLTEFVGYFNNFKNSPAFFLPKVFLPIFEAEGAQLITQLAVNGVQKADFAVSNISRSFISKFAFTFYLSLSKFLKRKNETTLLSESELSLISLRRNSHNTTQLEVVLSLMDFYYKHKDLLSFKYQENVSSSYSNVNWARTVRTSLPIHIVENIVYTSPYAIEDEIDFSNELLTVYFSLLNYFKSIYGFNVNIDNRYQLISYRNFTSFVSKCRNKIRKVKGAHFDDRFKRMSKLLQAYFELIDPSCGREARPDYILIRNYNIVFEDMIDLLLSNDNSLDELKNQKDGKVLDHIYQYECLMDESQIFYIGDSKYYKETTGFSVNAKYKQFTYAKNVIHYNIDPFNEKESSCRYRDPLTEGYNITPNFFINAFIDKLDLSAPQADFEIDPKIGLIETCHFENRVFDRDTLNLCSFKINFFFVLHNYVLEKQSLIKKFRQIAYVKIREHFLNLYNQQYCFFNVKPNYSVIEFVDKYFRQLNGKLFRNTWDLKNDTLTLGLSRIEKNQDNNKTLLSLIAEDAVITPFSLV